MTEHEFSIYGVEHPIKNSDIMHAFVVIADGQIEGQHGFCEHLEQLHFISSLRKSWRRSNVADYLIPEVTSDEPRDFMRDKITRYKSGHEIEIRTRWNQALRCAIKLRDLRLPFDESARPTAYNCRAGAKAALEAMGLEFSPGTGHRMTDGAGADLFAHIKAQLPPLRDGLSVKALRDETRGLELALRLYAV